MDRYDVVVVGAGLAGLQVSRLLAARGHSVLLMDRKRRLERAIHTTGIFVRRTFQDFLLPEDCLGPAVRQVTLYSPRRRRFSLASAHDEFRIADMGRLYERMLQAAIAVGVEWRPATELLAAKPQRDSCAVMIRDESDIQEVETRFLVGADGVVSRVAAALDFSQNQEWIVGVEDVYRGQPLDGAPSLHCFLDPLLAPGYIAWVAADGVETHVGVGGYAKWFEPKRALLQFTSSIVDQFGLRAAPIMETRGGRIPVGGILPHIVSRYGLLVGDASGAVSPLTAGGLDPCLRQSLLAAEVIDEFLAGGDGNVLQRYSGLRVRRRFLIRRLLRQILTAIRTPWAAEIVVGLLRVFPFSYLARQIFFGRGSFPVESSHDVSSVDTDRSYMTYRTYNWGPPLS